MPPVNVGARSNPDYDSVGNAAIYSLPGGRKVFAGQRDDGSLSILVRSSTCAARGRLTRRT
jgi:hypothetical protein